MWIRVQVRTGLQRRPYYYLHIQQTLLLYLYTCIIHVHTAQRVIITDFTDTLNVIVTENFQHHCINVLLQVFLYDSLPLSLELDSNGVDSAESVT